ncbi:methyltransferase family protein [Chloroflexota bacterium]
MSIYDRYADFVYIVATGGKNLKILITFPVAVFFFSLVVLLVFASVWVDQRFLFFRFDSSGWTLGLSILLLGIGWLICGWTFLSFIRTKGTPVPFNPPPRLITNGLYGYVRNPMLSGLFIFLIGLGGLLGSISLIFIFTPIFILINVLYLKAIEEKEMEKKFGTQYLEYKKRVPMFIPRLITVWKH